MAPFDPGATDAESGPLWCPRLFQGDGRHDNPDLYGVLYLSTVAVAAVVESLAPFRGTGPVTASLLRRAGHRLHLVTVEVPHDLPLMDFDDPKVLDHAALRPSLVASRLRSITQAQARSVFLDFPDIGGIGWWSTYESTWLQCSLFDHRLDRLGVVDVVPLEPALPEVAEAATWLGMT